MSVKWNGDAAVNHVNDRALQFLERAAYAVENRAKDLLSIAGTGLVSHYKLNYEYRLEWRQPWR